LQNKLNMTQPTMKAMEKFQQKIMKTIYVNDKCSGVVINIGDCLLVRSISVFRQNTALRGTYLFACT
jgi:hypothetical protein